MKETTVSRRTFLQISAGAVAGAVLAACTPAPTAAPTTAPKASEPTKPAAAATQAPAASKYKDSPFLAERIKSGKLPAVDQRLPKNPLVVKPNEKIGKFGGTQRIGLRGTGDNAGLVRMLLYNNLMRWDVEFKSVTPDMAESFTASPDAKEFTLKLRDAKWSDGSPFTADDVVFWYDDILMNKDLTATTSGSFWEIGGKPCKVTKVDANTVKFAFEQPYGIFVQNLAHPNGVEPISYPATYLKKFHKKYDPEVDKKATDAGLKTWVDYFRLHGGGGVYNAGTYTELTLPRLSPWVVTTPYDANATQFMWERNPYFWKVDPEGNQYPYIDKVQCDVGGDVQALVLKAMKGEIDFQSRHIATLANKPVFADNAEKGGYEFVDLIPANHCHFCLSVNMTAKDPELRKIFSQKDFRIGLSVAMDRKEIVDTVYIGQSKPFQPSPRPESPLYDEAMSTQYTQFDLAKAAEYFTKAGLKDKDAEGFYKLPNGKRLSFTLESSATYPEWNDALQLIQRSWKKAGIDMAFKVIDRGLLFQRMETNDIEATIWEGAGGLDVGLDPRWIMPSPTDATGSNFGVLWTYWYKKDSRGEEPPAEIKKQFELYDQYKATADEKKQNDLLKEIMKISKENFWAIGGVLAPKGYAIKKKNFKNVPKQYPDSWTYPTPGPINTFQCYFES